MLCHCQDFLRKLPELFVIRNACIVYLLNFGTQFFTPLKYLFSQIKQPCRSHFLMSFLRVPLFTLIYDLLLHLGFCKAYQNCLVALTKITTLYVKK